MRPIRLAVISLAHASAATALLAGPIAAHAEVQSRFAMDLPAQPLGDSIRALAVLSGRTILAEAPLVAGKQAPPLHGVYSVEEALSVLLSGTDLEFARAGDGFVIRRVPTPTSQADGAGDQAIVVTGTRIRGAAPVGSHLVTLDREAVDRSGFATTQQIMAAIPQNFGGGPNEGTVGFTVRNNANANIGFGSGVNLRGLGSTSTLVLVDGKRPALGGGSGTFVDLTLIPSTGIERIEILPDGASAIYGSDAVAGVVNVILRREFEGFETRARYGLADGFDEAQASQLAGFRWSSGHLTAGYENYGRGRLGAEDRAYATEDLRRFGGPDYRQSFSNPATIIAADGRVFGVPRGQNGVGLSASSLIAGVPNLGDGRQGTDILAQVRRHSAFATLDQDITTGLLFRLEGFFADRRSSDRYLPGNTGVVVTPANPFYVDPIGTMQPITVNYDFRRDLGPPILDAHVRNWGATGALQASLGQWSAELSGTYGVQREQQRTLNVPNFARLAVALADPNPATSFNLFGDGSFTNPTTIDRIRGGSDQIGRSSVGSASLKFDGPLFRLAAGDVRMAFGGEYRHERYAFKSTQDQFTLQPVDGGTAGFPLSRSVVAGYAELLVPIVAPDQHVALIDKLDVSVAGRVEHYSDFGTTANPRVGLNWRPASSLTLRSTFGTSFRAPSFIDIRHGPGLNQIVPLPLPDPASATGSSIVLALFGNSPEIGPEKARTWTAGFDFRPRRVPGLTISATYFDIAYRDRISNPANDLFSFLAQRSRFQSLITDDPDPGRIAALYADPTFINPFGIPASGVAILIDARNANLSKTAQSGVDFDVGYRLARHAQSFEIGLSGSYLLRLKEQITRTAPNVDVLSTIGHPVDLRLRGRGLATWGRLSVAAFGNFVNGYLNNGVAPAEKVHSWTTFDLQLSYDVGSARGSLRDLRLALSITNIFDRAPPYVNNRTPTSASGFDPENASPIGRLVAFQLTKSW